VVATPAAVLDRRQARSQWPVRGPGSLFPRRDLRPPAGRQLSPHPLHASRWRAERPGPAGFGALATPTLLLIDCLRGHGRGDRGV